MSSPIQAQLKQLSEEIRVQVHLAGMEAKDAWSRLEPRLREYERKVEAASGKVADELASAGKKLHSELQELLGKIKKA